MGTRMNENVQTSPAGEESDDSLLFELVNKKNGVIARARGFLSQTITKFWVPTNVNYDGRSVCAIPDPPDMCIDDSLNITLNLSATEDL